MNSGRFTTYQALVTELRSIVTARLSWPADAVAMEVDAISRQKGKGKGKTKSNEKGKGKEKPKVDVANHECYYCGKKGHLKVDCKARKQDEKEGTDKRKKNAGNKSGASSSTAGVHTVSAQYVVQDYGDDYDDDCDDDGWSLAIYAVETGRQRRKGREH